MHPQIEPFRLMGMAFFRFYNQIFKMLFVSLNTRLSLIRNFDGIKLFHTIDNVLGCSTGSPFGSISVYKVFMPKERCWNDHRVHHSWNIFSRGSSGSGVRLLGGLMSASTMSACLKKTVGSATDNVTPPGADVPAITSTLSWFFSSSRPIFPKNENRI